MTATITLHDVKEVYTTTNETTLESGLVYNYLKVYLTDKDRAVTEFTVFTTDKSVNFPVTVEKDVAMLIEGATYEAINLLTDKQQQLEELASELSDKIDELEAFSIKTEDEAIEAYDDMLNESIDSSSIPSFILPGTAAEAMKENDPTMYRCGFNDFLDCLDKDDQVVPEHTEWSVG